MICISHSFRAQEALNEVYVKVGSLGLEHCITKVPDREVTKTAKLSIFFLLLSVSLSHASTIMVEAITMIQIQKKSAINHLVLHSLFIVVIALKSFFRDSQALRC